jgi:predicted aldo/keto reductase-like oxidoreductase
VPRATDCYRFALSPNEVDACLTGPKDRRELDEALLALDEGPMSEEELAWMRRVGAAVRAGAKRGVFRSSAA